MLPGGSDAVRGELYLVDEPTLRALDALEGHPGFYRRVRIELEDGSQALSYVLAPARARGRARIESGDWRRRRVG